MRWGEAVRGGCKDCGCDRYEETGADIAPAPLAAPVRPVVEPAAEAQGVVEPAPQPGDVLGSYDAWLCRSCGSRYGYDHGHGCGPLTPVAVLIVAAEPDHRRWTA
jgi:hypothetical protein